MYKRHRIGRIGEEVTIKYLTKNGYEIIERNFFCNQGEIDVIAKYKNELIFIEVKTRTNLKYGYPIDAINQIKKKHIYNATNYYVYKNNLEKEYIRIDAIEVYVMENKIKIKHIKQIF